jgi:selenocysteine lyase/cysteine desulfurase
MRQTLQAAGIDVSYRENGTQVRVSPALFNVREDIDSFLKALDPLRR